MTGQDNTRLVEWGEELMYAVLRALSSQKESDLTDHIKYIKIRYYKIAIIVAKSDSPDIDLMRILYWDNIKALPAFRAAIEDSANEKILFPDPDDLYNCYQKLTKGIQKSVPFSKDMLTLNPKTLIVDWESIARGFEYAAQDKDNQVWFYTDIPFKATQLGITYPSEFEDRNKQTKVV